MWAKIISFAVCLTLFGVGSAQAEHENLAANLENGNAQVISAVDSADYESELREFLKTVKPAAGPQHIQKDDERIPYWKTTVNRGSMTGRRGVQE